MPIAWFVAPYTRRTWAPGTPGPSIVRYCAVDDFGAQILADGGSWATSECLGSYGVVKVRASVATLTAISAAPGVLGIPGQKLTDPLSSLTALQKAALRAKVQSLGYSLAEIQARFPNDLGSYTLADVLRFVCSRRLRPRYDQATDTIILDGQIDPVRPVDDVDLAVA